MSEIRKKQLNNQKGTALVVLLVFAVVAITVTTAATTIAIVNTQGTTELAGGEGVYFVAESGVENAVLRLLRDPTYSGETLSVGAGSATITITGSGTITITSVGTLGNNKKTLQVVGTLSNNEFTQTSWKEID